VWPDAKIVITELSGYRRKQSKEKENERVCAKESVERRYCAWRLGGDA